MDKSELISEFKGQLALFEKYQSFIDKARAYADRFNPAVVEKVISDNTEKIREVSGALDPLVGQMRGVIASIEEQRDAVYRGVEESRLSMEELELRLAIGEIDQGGYDSTTADLRRVVDSADDQAKALDAELDDFRSTLDSWLTRRPSDDDSSPVADDEEDILDEPDPEPEEHIDLEHEDEEEEEEDELLEFQEEGPGRDGVHAEKVSVTDDVSAVFDGGDDSPLEVEDGQEGQETGGISFGDEIAGLRDDLLGEERSGRNTAVDASDGRAVLILGEGTSDERPYSFVGESLSVGRGRDNTIQVKNDSKVSRYHCRIFRRNGAYYIEDNKSANGTLVDGELITEKRLFGGEEVIVGETFFRFRIQH